MYNSTHTVFHSVHHPYTLNAHPQIHTHPHMDEYTPNTLKEKILPRTVRLAESEDFLLLATVHAYVPMVRIFSVCVYCAVTGSTNTVSVPSVILTESLVQVTVVAGPPVEIQVRVN